MYRTLDAKLGRGEIVVLDGGTGTELQRRGAPMHGDTWAADATRSHPEILRAVHADYIRAGAEVIVANTFATSALLFDALGRLDEMAEIDALAVRIAQAAREEAGRPVAVAGSISVMRPVPKGSDRTPQARQWPEARARALLRGKAEGLAAAGVDLICMEMMRDLDYSLWATEAAVATGLPVWVGVSVERRVDGKLAGTSRHDFALADLIDPLMATGARALLVMHTSIADTDEALAMALDRFRGPVGVYPESGHFRMPDWQFVDIIAADDFAEKCRGWARQGARLLGGCCGTGPEHIRALVGRLASDAP